MFPTYFYALFFLCVFLPLLVFAQHHTEHRKLFFIPRLFFLAEFSPVLCIIVVPWFPRPLECVGGVSLVLGFCASTGSLLDRFSRHPPPRLSLIGAFFMLGEGRGGWRGKGLSPLTSPRHYIFIVFRSTGDVCWESWRARPLARQRR